MYTVTSEFEDVDVPSGFVTSQLLCKPVVVQYAPYTDVMWKLETYIENRLKGRRRCIMSSA